jgi:hypothetical protein
MASFEKITGITSSEQVYPTQVNLLATGLSPAIQQSPTSMLSPIEAIRFLITASVVNGTTAITSGTVGGSIGLIEIKQGTKTLLKVSNMKELQDFYHIKTGLVLSDVNIPTTASQTDSASLEFVLPFRIAVEEQVVIKTQFNGYSSFITGGSVSSGSGSVGLAFLYSNKETGFSEMWDIEQTPTTLASGTDVNLGSYLGNAKPIYELYADVSSDSDLNYYKFEITKTVLFNQYPFDLIQYEVQEPQYSHVSGLFRLPIVSGIVINTGSNSQAKAVINLATSEQIYLISRIQ